ncbi:MAG: response regulator [Cyanothece sp. SIO1E1]|nr:response regulator [Cyanothece sp. SIO1E1]
MRVLLIEDDEVAAETLVTALSDQHYVVDVAADGQAGWEFADAFTYDLILLDVMLPKLDGISLCRRLRSQGQQTPVLLLTAQDTSTNKVMGLDAGADDYMTKPFDLQELLARIRALLRREGSTLLPVLKWGGLQLDPSTCEVTYNNQTIHLRPKEYDLLELFLRNSQRVFSRSAILDHLWSFEETPGEETVTAHIKGLRRNLKAAGVPYDPIETVYGIGYRLRPIETETCRDIAPQRLTQREPEEPSSVTPTQINHPAKAEQRSLAVAAGIWERAKAKFTDRIDIIGQAATALLADRLDGELRQRAEREAHKLVGSLGMFNFDARSELARAIEQLLQQAERSLNPAQKLNLSQLVAGLSQEIQQAMTGSIPNLLQQPAPQQTIREVPLLLIVTSDPSLAEILGVEATACGLEPQMALTSTDAGAKIARDRPDVVVLDLQGDLSPATATLAASTSTFLAELNAYTPPVPALVLTVQNDLIDRVNVARLGGRGFLPRCLPPAQVLAAVNQVLERSRPVAARVMAVDDDPQVLMVLRELLEPWGIKLSGVDDPQQFWETLEATAPDLLILDIEMPHMNGLELCQVVRNDLHWGSLPILFLTAYTDMDTMRQVFEAGADDYVSKPIVGPELLTRILNRLERSRLLQNIAATDALTGVTNRRQSHQALTQLLHLAERYHQPLCFASLDIDHLKHINQQYSHAIGDAMLSHLGKLLRQTFQAEDVIGRWGGGEFVIGMYGMNRNDGMQRLSEMLNVLHQEALTVANNDPVRITFSAGIVQYPEDGHDLQTLYRAADAMLQQAKKGGGDRIVSAR